MTILYLISPASYFGNLLQERNHAPQGRLQKLVLRSFSIIIPDPVVTKIVFRKAVCLYQSTFADLPFFVEFPGNQVSRHRRTGCPLQF